MPVSCFAQKAMDLRVVSERTVKSLERSKEYPETGERMYSSSFFVLSHSDELDQSSFFWYEKIYSR